MDNQDKIIHKLNYIKDQHNLQISCFKQIDGRISNRLAILGTFLLIIITSISQIIYLYNNYTYIYAFIATMISLILLSITFIICLYYIIKSLTVVLYTPGINNKGFHKDIELKLILNSFLLNYLKAYKKNEDIFKIRKKMGDLIIKWNKRTLYLLIIYLLILSISRLFFTTLPITQ